MASKHPPPPNPPPPARKSSLLGTLGLKKKDNTEPHQASASGPVIPQRFASRELLSSKPKRVPDSELPDPIRRDRPFPKSSNVLGPSIRQPLVTVSSPPPPPTPRKDTPPEQKKKKRRVKDTQSSPAKPSKSSLEKPYTKRLEALNSQRQCDSLHLYCLCNKRPQVSAGILAKLKFGNPDDPDDFIGNLDLTGLDLKQPGGLGIFNVQAPTPTSVLGSGPVTADARAQAIFENPKLLQQVIQNEQRLLKLSEKKKREEFERREALDREAEARRAELERQAVLAEKAEQDLVAEEIRQAKEAEESEVRQLEENIARLKAENEKLRKINERNQVLKALQKENKKLKKQNERSTVENQKKQHKMVFEGGTAYPESDADDEYERSVHDSSPVLATDDEETESEGSGGQTSNEHTPTTYGRMGRDRDSMPEAIITEWTADECADFLASLGLGQYADGFLENEITGEALIALLHEDLKEVGIVSVGHRLTILKAVYELKIKQDVPVDSDHYVPLTADTQAQNAPATVRDIRAILERMRLHDDRLYQVESQIAKIFEENRRLREDLLPVFKMVKEAQPLPYHPPAPQQNYAQQYANAYSDPNSTISPPAPTPKSSGLGSGGLQRKFSTKQFFLGSTPKNASPTHLQQQNAQDRSMMEQSLDPSAAAERAVISSSHLAAMNGGQSQTSPGFSPNIPSPSSPPHALKYTMSGSTLGSRSYSRNNDMQQTPRQTYTGAGGSDVDTLRGDNTPHTSSHYPRDSIKAPTTSRRAPTPAPGGSSSADQIEVFKSFKVSMDDPCWKVLPAALKKYKIEAPTEQYALYLVYGDQERCVEPEEKPLILFKELDKQGRKPMFMLRKTTAHPDSAASGATTAERGGVDGRLPLRGQTRGQQYEPPGGII